MASNSDSLQALNSALKSSEYAEGGTGSDTAYNPSSLQEQSADTDDISPLTPANDSDALLVRADENPSLERRIVDLLRSWAVLAQFMHPTIARDDLWKSEFVTSFATFFLAFRVQLPQGRGGGQVGVITFFNWATTLIQCIGRYSRDAHGNCAGDEVLYTNKVLASIRILVKNLIRRLKLQMTIPDEGNDANRVA